MSVNQIKAALESSYAAGTQKKSKMSVNVYPNVLGEWRSDSEKHHLTQEADQIVIDAVKAKVPELEAELGRAGMLRVYEIIIGGLV